MLFILYFPPFFAAIGAAQNRFDIPKAAPEIFESVTEQIREYAVLHFWDAHCAYFTAGDRTADSTIARIAPSLGTPLIAWSALEVDPLVRECTGLVILGENASVVSAAMQRAIEINWSFRVIALLQIKSDYYRDDGSLFSKEEISSWRSYDMLLIQFGPRSFHVRQYLVHQADFRKTSLEKLKSDLNPNKRHNFRRREMNISAFSCPLFVIFKKKNRRGGAMKLSDIDGIEYRIFLEFAKQLNFSWNLETPAGRDKWGMPRFKKEAPFGMIKWLIDRKIELAICSWWLEEAKRKYIDLSTYWNSVCMTFLVPKPNPYLVQWSCFVRPFSPDLWALLIVTMSFVTWVYWMNLDARNLTVKPVISFDRSIFHIFGMLLANESIRPSKKEFSKYNRFLLLQWAIFTIIIVSVYSGSLAARLTLPEFEPMIQTPEDLGRSKYLLTAYYKSSWLVFTSREYNINLRLIKPSVKTLDDTPSAFFTKLVGYKYFMEVENLPATFLEDLRAPKHCMEQHYMTFAVPRGSGLARHINPIIRRLVETGITTYWLTRVFESQYSIFPFTKAYDYRDARAKEIALSFFYLQSAFVLWLFGNFAGFVTFLAELYRKRKEEMKIQDLLRPDLTRKNQLKRFQFGRMKIQWGQNEGFKRS